MESKCISCGRVLRGDGIGTGYGVNKSGERVCYDCCGEMDREQMRKGDRIYLYLTRERNEKSGLFTYAVGNWPGTLKIPINEYSNSRHNWGLLRTDVWFNFEGKRWWGFNVGTNSQICHCRVIK